MRIRNPRAERPGYTGRPVGTGPDTPRKSIPDTVSKNNLHCEHFCLYFVDTGDSI